VKQARPKCGTCRYCDRESYRGVKAMVCYQLQSEIPPWMDGKRVAVRVGEKKDACHRYSEIVNKAQ